jgi:hypothetical protein
MSQQQQAALRAQQAALGLNMSGLGLHGNAAAAAAAAAATTAALQSLARNGVGGGGGGAGGSDGLHLHSLGHSLPPLGPNNNNAAALQSLSNEINASLLSNGELVAHVVCFVSCIFLLSLLS